MQVVLKHDVKGLGKANEVKSVSEGYARNFLIPRGLAIPATKESLEMVAREQQHVTTIAAQQRARAEAMAARLKDKPLLFKVKAGETGRMYGSITAKDIAEAIGKALGAEFDKRMVELEHPIRQTGVHLVELKLPANVTGQVQVVVEAEDQ
ncbi:MAG: 50S ribosomal protein L9 [Chloroflexi bacterium ADurb.Bin360]|nr:MAG: 50S ribosomal protein L9 [Chloroflexi bacterium ADurb.Bin360]